MAEESWKELVDLDWVNAHYDELVRKNAYSYSATGWPSHMDQWERFKVLAGLIEETSGFTVLDYGCGLADFHRYLEKHGFTDFGYVGYDTSEQMFRGANTLLGSVPRAYATSSLEGGDTYNYVVASGIFNLPPPDTPSIAWSQHILHTIREFDRLSTSGFAFNVLSCLSRTQTKGFFYGHPGVFFDVCFRMTRKASLVHDYGLNDFTIVVRK